MRARSTIPAGNPVNGASLLVADRPEASASGQPAPQAAPVAGPVNLPPAQVARPMPPRRRGRPAFVTLGQAATPGDPRPTRRGRQIEDVEQDADAPPRFYSLEQLAASIGVNRRWVWDRCQPRGPLPVHLLSGNVVRVSLRDWQQFLRSFKVG